MTPQAAGPALEEEVTDDSSASHGWRTTLFNCECHTFDQVESQLQKATGCSLSRARALSTEVHTKGAAVVCEGSRERCRGVGVVLEAIGLLVQVSQ